MTDQIHTDHIKECTLVDYLAGELDESGELAVEAHVEACSVCAARLTEHARVETVLYEVAQNLPPAAPQRPWHRVGVAAAAFVSMAAALVLTVGSPAHWIEFDQAGLGESGEQTGPLQSSGSVAADFVSDLGCAEESTPEGVTCGSPLAVALATYPDADDSAWDSFSPDDGSDLNWCAVDEDTPLMCVPADQRPG